MEVSPLAYTTLVSVFVCPNKEIEKIRMMMVSRVLIKLQLTTGLCAGVVLAFRPPGTADWLVDKDK